MACASGPPCPRDGPPGTDQTCDIPRCGLAVHRRTSVTPRRARGPRCLPYRSPPHDGCRAVSGSPLRPLCLPPRSDRTSALAGRGSLVLRRSCVQAYARVMTRLRDPRGRAALVLVIALLGLVTAWRSSTDRAVVGSSQADAMAIESVPTVLVTTSDRPGHSLHMRPGEGQRALGVMTVSAPTVGVPASVPRSVGSSPSVLSAGLVAQWFAGRGPPSPING